ncbi:MAG: malonyl-ACP O-methyltransferase BioC [Deltaproteobacteria bacterium]|nr:malonyl-ACP O-methyltransferase BioC [Deltaproteobacteria bacterium]
MEYKERIRQSFSRAAPTYDHYAFIQKAVAGILIDRLDGRLFQNILEVGCGTGNYTHMLTQRFSEAYITAIDFSGAMIARAAEKLNNNERVCLCVEDAETFSFKTEQGYDLITSNSTFQWLTDFKKVIKHYKTLLADEGLILFSMMGPETFYELHEVMEEVLPEKVKISARYFRQFDEIESFLHEIFKKVKTSETVLTREYNNLLDLLKTMKYTGVNIRRNGNNILFTPALIKKAEKAYIKRFGSIRTSYQVFLCEGKR